MDSVTCEASTWFLLVSKPPRILQLGRKNSLFCLNYDNQKKTQKTNEQMKKKTHHSLSASPKGQHPEDAFLCLI